MDFKIRAYEEEDAQGLIDLFERSVSRIGPAKYKTEQVAAWLGGSRDAGTWNARILPREAYVAHDPRGRLLGWIEMDLDGCIDYLYCAPEASRQGVADVLLTVLLVGARKLGIRKCTTAASLFAESFFRRNGWTVTQWETINREGIELPRARMSLVVGTSLPTLGRP